MRNLMDLVEDTYYPTGLEKIAKKLIRMTQSNCPSL
jgi:hypothetical protein